MPCGEDGSARSGSATPARAAEATSSRSSSGDDMRVKDIGSPDARSEATNEGDSTCARPAAAATAKRGSTALPSTTPATHGTGMRTADTRMAVPRTDAAARHRTARRRHVASRHSRRGTTRRRARAAGMSQERIVQIEQDILAKNDAHRRAEPPAFADRGIFALNLVSSPGSGKTTLLVRTIEALRRPPADRR